MLKQISNPLRIFHIRLATWNSFDMLSIDHQQFKMTFQDVVHGFSEHSSTLHCYMGDPECGEPFAHPKQISSHGTKGLTFFGSLTLGVRDDAQATIVRL